MKHSDLPPGCSASDIPGNRPEDEAWDNLFDDIGASGLTAEGARVRWEALSGLNPEGVRDLVEAAESALRLNEDEQTFQDEATRSVSELLRTALKKIKLDTH